MRRAKIVATIGPATETPEMVRSVLGAGVDVVRLNAAHGSADVHAARAAFVREQAAALGRDVGVLVDMPGPKLRSGPVAGDEVELAAGDGFVLTAEAVVGDARRVSTTVPEMARWLQPGDDLYLADGEIVLAVTEIAEGDVRCKVVRGGVLRSRKGMHVPKAERHVEPFTDADARALEMAAAIDADFIGMSFVRRPEDVETVRAALVPGHRPSLVAKIETAVALDHLPGIVARADAVMVARGDLGIQVPARRVPLIQKEIIRFCNVAGKPVITATQMLESMTRAPLPTRAEVNDVANAVIDGTDALMLSEETAVGSHPVDAVRMMAEVAESAETWPRHEVRPAGDADEEEQIAWAVAHAAVEAAEDLRVRAVLCVTRRGETARRVAAYRPTVPVVGCSPFPDVRRKLALVWGVRPLAVPDDAEPEARVTHALDAARTAGLAAAGEPVVVVAVSPDPRAGGTDEVRVLRA